MAGLNRRSALMAAFTAGTAVVACEQESSGENNGLTADQQFVMSAGLTEAEADCWKKVAEAAGAFFQLPELHSMDRAEVASAIHIIQNKLLGRPTYRKYLAAAKQNEDQDR